MATAEPLGGFHGARGVRARSSDATVAPDAAADDPPSVFWFPPVGDFGPCPAMVQQLGFGACADAQLFETCTRTGGTVCECIRVDGEGQTPEVVCPAPGVP